MSIYLSREFAPVELGGEGKAIPRDLACPDCNGRPGGRLWKHDSHVKTIKQLDHEGGIKLRVTRLRCSVCGTSHAVLFEHLLPYQRYSTGTLEQLAAPYLFNVNSYDKAGWVACSDEGAGHRHLVYEVVARLCQASEWISSYVERQRNWLEGSVWKRKDPIPEEPCPNAYKAKTAVKKAALNQVSKALVRFQNISGGNREELIGLLHRAGMGLKTPFPLLTSRASMRLSATHNRGNRLF